MDLDATCDALLRPDSPLNSNAKVAGQQPLCPMASVRASLAAGEPWPMASCNFTTALLTQIMHTEPRLASTVGLRGDVSGLAASEVAPEQLAWVLLRLNSRYNTANGQMLGSPTMIEAYMREWKDYFQQLPQLTNSSDAVLSKGFVTCRSWEIYPTIVAFLEGVIRSLLFTPLFCLGAVFAIVRDIAICYAALLSVASMIVVTMGLLHLFGMPLGPIESLALAVIIGVSVYYLIHLAFAYKHSLMQTRYFKSRAAVLARSNSIASAALTTLCSVLPLLGGRLAPLRQFGRIFTVVTVVSFLFSYGFFNAFLMAAGSLITRTEGPRVDADDDAEIQDAQLVSADEAGWDMLSENDKLSHPGRIRRTQVLPAPPPAEPPRPMPEAPVDIHREL